jgi:hypothetical protein
MLVRRLEAHKAELVRRSADVELLIEEAKALVAPSDPLLGLRPIKDRYGVGRVAIRSAIDRGELQAKKGPHNDEYLIRQSELERWLSSKPYVPRQRKSAEWKDDPDAKTEQWFQELTRGAP